MEQELEILEKILKGYERKIEELNKKVIDYDNQATKKACLASSWVEEFNERWDNELSLGYSVRMNIRSFIRHKHQDTNNFIKAIAKLLGDDNLGQDGISWSIDDFENAILELINKKRIELLESLLKEHDEKIDCPPFDIIDQYWIEEKIKELQQY